MSYSARNGPTAGSRRQTNDAARTLLSLMIAHTGLYIASCAPPCQTPTPEILKAVDDNPPPKEKQFILVQAQNSLSGDTHFDVRTVGPSRVAILTQPVGSDRPAQLATWTMFRLISPEPGKAIAPLPTLHRLGPWRDCARHGVDREP